jgi:MFS family permease
VSGLFLLTGALVQFFASAPGSVIFGLVVSACGCGYDVTARSLVALVIQPEALGTVYAAITVMSSIGMVIAGPMMAATFRWGMRLGDGNFWLGMPFLVAAALYALAVLAVGVTRLDEETIRRLSQEDSASLIGRADGDHDDEGQYVGHQV